MTPIEQIDEVLLLFQEKSESAIHRVTIDEKLKEKNINLTYEQLTEILYKLVKDGYLRIESHVAETIQGKPIVDYYIITFEGELFIQGGSYKSELKRKINADTFLSVTTKLTVVALWVGAISTTGLLIWEVSKVVYRHWHH